MALSWFGYSLLNGIIAATRRDGYNRAITIGGTMLVVAGAMSAIGLAYRMPATTLAPDLLHHTALHMAETSAAAGTGRPATMVTPISCEKLPNVPGKSLTLALVDYPPDAYTPRHRHPGAVSAFVVKGTLRSQLDGGPVGTYGTGQSWFEPPGAIHMFAENASKTEPAQLLAMFIADDDCGPLVIPD